MTRACFIQHGKSPIFVNITKIPYFDKCKAIGSGYILFHNTDKETPNLYLQQFGYAFSNIQGDALIMYEPDDFGLEDIDFNFEKRLKAILKNVDQIQRTHQAMMARLFNVNK